MSSNTSSSSLPTWDQLCSKKEVFKERPSLLIGNGFSINIWSNFKYKSLLEKAISESLLISKTQSLFTSLETEDFEGLLRILAASKPVFAALQQNKQLLEQCEINIRESLIEAVQRVHVPWSEIPKSTYQTIATELTKYKSIYSTNYDLIVYWSIMTERHSRISNSPYKPLLDKLYHKLFGQNSLHQIGLSSVSKYHDDFADYFWNNPFNIFSVLNTKKEYKNRSLIHYLHGGLHLYIDNDTVQTFKRINDGKNILDKFKRNPNETPLFISEGTSKDKLRSIRRSDYLSYVFSCFENDKKPLVILGHKLSDNDQHIANAINTDWNRHVAISVLNSGNIDEKIKRFKRVLQGMNNLHFFDAATHPLLVKNLQVG